MKSLSGSTWLQFFFSICRGAMYWFCGFNVGKVNLINGYMKQCSLCRHETCTATCICFPSHNSTLFIWWMVRLGSTAFKVLGGFSHHIFHLWRSQTFYKKNSHCHLRDWILINIGHSWHFKVSGPTLLQGCKRLRDSTVVELQLFHSQKGPHFVTEGLQQPLNMHLPHV